MMNCISTPEMTETELMKYLDHVASVDVVSHVNHCAYCQDRATQLQHVQKRLGKGLRRVTCPSSMELGEYHLDMLAPRQATAIRQHVDICPHCRREIDDLCGFLGDWSPQQEPSPVQRFQILVAQLVSSATQSLGNIKGASLSPALMGAVRDEDKDERPTVYRVNDVEIVIEAQNEYPEQTKKTVLGYVRGLKADSLNVYLWRGEEPIAAIEVDEQGHFVFEHIPSGIYNLTVRDADLEVHVREIAL